MCRAYKKAEEIKILLSHTDHEDKHRIVKFLIEDAKKHKPAQLHRKLLEMIFS